MRRWILSSFLFITAFAIYLHGAYPTVSPGDSGEFITAAYGLGIPHAPGYPTYVVLAKVFGQIIPWGNYGYQINLFSAGAGALAVVLVFGLCLSLRFSPPVAFFAAVLFLGAQAQRVNAQASEVFALHAAFCAAVLYALVAKRWLLAVFLMGLGLGNHQTLLFLGPACLGAYWMSPREQRVRSLALLYAFFGGLSIYAFLLLRAGEGPLMNAGDPDTWQRLWRVLTRQDYGTLTLALGETPPRTAAATLQHLERFFRGLADQVSWAGVILGALALLPAWRAKTFPGWSIPLAFVFLGPFFFLLGNLPFNAQSIGLLERFYIAPTLCWIVLLAAGVQRFSARFSWFGWTVAGLALLTLVPHLGDASQRGDLRAYAYGRNNLRTLPPRALFMMDGGDDTFYTFAYLTQVEKRRGDLRGHDRGGVVFPGFYGDDFRSLSRPDKEQRRIQVERGALLSGNAVYYSTMNDTVLPGTRLAQEGVLYRAITDDRALPLDTLWQVYDLRGIAPWHVRSALPSPDYRTRALLPFYAYQRSVASGRAERWLDALNYSHSAQANGPDVLWLLPNLRHNFYRWGQQLIHSGQMEMAERFYRELLRWDPAAAEAWVDIGAILDRKGRTSEAIDAYRRAIALNPALESAHFNLAVAYWKQSDWPNVVAAYTRVLQINPNNAAAQNYLAEAQRRISSR